MNRDDVMLKLQEIFDDLFVDPPRLTPALSAREVPEWDSLLHISLVVAVEKQFAIRFRVGDVDTTTNVGDFADLILRRVQEGAAH